MAILLLLLRVGFLSISHYYKQFALRAPKIHNTIYRERAFLKAVAAPTQWICDAKKEKEAEDVGIKITKRT